MAASDGKRTNRKSPLIMVVGTVAVVVGLGAFLMLGAAAGVVMAGMAG